MADISRRYEIIALASTKWTPAYGFPEGKVHPNYTGIVSEDTEKIFKRVAFHDINDRTGLYAKIFPKMYEIEEHLANPDIKDAEDLAEYIKLLTTYFAGKYIIRQGYLPASYSMLRRVIADDEQFEKIKLCPRKTITTIAQNEPRIVNLIENKIDFVASVDFKANELHKEKAKILFDNLCERGFPPETVAKYFDALYVYEESTAFSQREDIYTFYADDVIRDYLKMFELDEGFVTQVVVYDGRKIV